MTEWWSSIPAGEKIYWYFAIPFSVLFIILTVLTIIGVGESDGLDDAGGDIDDIPDTEGYELNEETFDSGPAPFRLLTIRNFIVFFTVFAWAGIVLSRNKVNGLLTVLVACVAGFAVCIIISTIFYVMTRLVESGGMDFKNAVGCRGEVYLTIPGERRESGKVTVTVQGVSRELDAVTDGGELPTGTCIRVIDVIDNQVLLVEDYNKRSDVL